MNTQCPICKRPLARFDNLPTIRGDRICIDCATNSIARLIGAVGKLLENEAGAGLADTYAVDIALDMCEVPPCSAPVNKENPA
jgi:hypothetical protein